MSDEHRCEEEAVGDAVSQVSETLTATEQALAQALTPLVDVESELAALKRRTASVKAPAARTSAASGHGRQAEKLAAACVELADTLTDDFEVTAFLHRVTERCVEVLDIAAAGVLLTDHQGELGLSSASSEQARLLGVLQLQCNQGPGIDCFTRGRRIDHIDAGPVDSSPDQFWPQFQQAAREAGFHSVYALPMRHGRQMIGTLNLFRNMPEPLDDHSAMLGQALADVPAIAIAQQRFAREQELLSQQLREALDRRVLIEQAKGIIAGQRGISLDEAFAELRSLARADHIPLSALALRVISAPEHAVLRRRAPENRG
ncbi:ANTAR domain-containing protein [Streptomyces sp. NPDC087856]|uniref:ANTAR domain-containing protein n=1 Tax=Streptomyces sp. NPDC087856 TaxID=3365811 RepID=UPI00380F72CF